MADLNALARAYRRAASVSEAAERVAQEQIRRKRAAKEAAREALALGIVEEWTSGALSQAEIARRTGYGREQVRRILRAHGVEPGE